MRFSRNFWIPKIEKINFVTPETTTYTVFHEFLEFLIKNLYPRVLLRGEFSKVMKISFFNFFGFQKSIFRIWNPIWKMDSKNYSKMCVDNFFEFSVQKYPLCQNFAS